MRYAIKFAYDGRNFHGLQRQPGVESVEGEILHCLTEHRVITDSEASNFQVASRTDANVSALGNVMAFDTEFRINDVLNILNSNLKNCWFYGLSKVDNRFNPRNANLRWYRYHLYKAESIHFPGQKNTVILDKKTILKLMSIVGMFSGEHDFSNFSNPQLEDTVRTIDSIDVEETAEWVVFDFKAKSFLWNQLRRLVNAWVKYLSDEIERSDLESALNKSETRYDFGLAPAEPLVLMDVYYNFDFKIDSELLKKTKNRLQKRIQDEKLKLQFFNYLMPTLK
jgi:tRNA pseudouridine38-40 synthase